MPLTDLQLRAFNAISNFVLALGKEFGPRQHSLALYARLIEHTTLTHEDQIRRHIAAFDKYVLANQTSIEKADATILTGQLNYTDRIYIDLPALFRMAEPETQKIIWSHLLTILGVLRPDSQAREILKKMKGQAKTAETELVGEMINKIVPHLDANETNPMAAVMGLMQSGVFGDLVQTMQKSMDDGSVNVQSLLGTVGTLFAQADPTNRLEEKK